MYYLKIDLHHIILEIICCFQVDIFNIEAVDMKTLQRITVGHDGVEDGQGWFLNKVVITVVEPAASKPQDKKAKGKAKGNKKEQPDSGKSSDVIKEYVFNCERYAF